MESHLRRVALLPPSTACSAAAAAAVTGDSTYGSRGSPRKSTSSRTTPSLHSARRSALEWAASCVTSVSSSSALDGPSGSVRSSCATMGSTVASMVSARTPGRVPPYHASTPSACAAVALSPPHSVAAVATDGMAPSRATTACGRAHPHKPP